MKPYAKLAEAETPDGTVFTLHEHDGEFYLKNDGRELMSTVLTCSEQFLAEAGCAPLTGGRGGRPKCPRVLIGGLGLGFTLRRTLEIIGHPAEVTVAELVPEVVEWNRTFLGEANGPLLDDPRTKIYRGDLFDCLTGCGADAFDVILIDLDDTPHSLVVPQNSRLYTPNFLKTIQRALAPGGSLAFWLAEATPSFLKSLRRAGFEAEGIPAKQHERSKRARHYVYVCRARQGRGRRTP